MKLSGEAAFILVWLLAFWFIKKKHEGGTLKYPTLAPAILATTLLGGLVGFFYGCSKFGPISFFPLLVIYIFIQVVVLKKVFVRDVSYGSKCPKKEPVSAMRTYRRKDIISH